jgi:hypothetical protein
VAGDLGVYAAMAHLNPNKNRWESRLVQVVP